MKYFKLQSVNAHVGASIRQVFGRYFSNEICEAQTLKSS